VNVFIGIFFGILNMRSFAILLYIKLFNVPHIFYVSMLKIFL
jgi:hypothetical protein